MSERWLAITEFANAVRFAVPTTARLIPIVTTANTLDAVELAQTYIHRWPA